MSNWKAYDEVHFSNEYILRWVREGDEYVSRITCDMMDDLQSIVRQQADRIAELEECINACYAVQKMQAEEVYKGNDRIAELEKQCAKYEELIASWNTPQTKPLSNDEIREIGDECELKNNGILNWIEFTRAIEERHGIK